MHKTSGQRDPAAAFPLPVRRDDAEERRLANRAIGVSAAGLARGRRIKSATLIGDARHSWLDALSSAGSGAPRGPVPTGR